VNVNAVLAQLPYQSWRKTYGDAWVSPDCYPRYVEIAAKLQPRRILEIGAFEGYGLIAFWMGAGEQATRLDWVDTERDLAGSNGRALANLERAAELLGWPLPESTHATSLAGLPGSAPYDLIHIDGDHNVGAAMRDMVWALLRGTRVLLVDDYDYRHEPGVRQAVELFSEATGLAFEHIPTQRGWAMFRPGANP
jgi:predicted O-methyltransferase YrrM